MLAQLANLRVADGADRRCQRMTKQALFYYSSGERQTKMIARRFRDVVVLLSCFGTIASPVALAAPNLIADTRLRAQPRCLAPRDVALQDGGVLVGQVLDAQGKAIAGAPVAVQTAGKAVANTITDKNGRFRVEGLRGGVHLVATVGQQGVYRCWATQTAPPAAQRGLMLVSSTDVVRGQCGCGTPVCGSPVCGCGGGGGIGNWMANHPIFTAGAIATAIAVPLAVDDDDDTPPATP